MYCRSCGSQMDNTATVCMKCGVPIGKGKSYCPTCGKPTCAEAVMCVNCGGGLVYRPDVNVSEKSSIVAGLLGIFLGALGIHNFYLGYTKKAVAQLVLFLAFIFSLVTYVILIVGAVTSLSVLMGALAVLTLMVGIVCAAVSLIWSFIEAIMILCGSKKYDAKGNILKS